MMLSLGARCCCDCRSLSDLAMLSLGSCYLLQLLLPFTYYLVGVIQALDSAVYCRSFAVLVLSTAAAAVHLLSLLSW
ncbi:hypothetical protein MAM1_0087d04772 [Mucor ambiguus]|uniref:Uncharacterized protein n=1 Tax=Mucor ambiguus TaxID=91626 RepID=A0A0C9MPX0_9FUNG|nr:hypothetical protein MAM1_0087d04772 [Mucor ambiguus]